MASTRTYALVLGIRPEIVKLAPLIRSARQHPEIEMVVIHTGQHYDASLSQVFFEELELPQPDIQLHLRGEQYSEKLGNMIHDLKETLASAKKEWSGVIMLGDSNSSLAAGLAAASLRIPVIHVEAGLRSHDSRMPEEANRVILDHLSDKLFITEEAAHENLIKEGIAEERIHFVGNIAAESLELFEHKIDKTKPHETLKLEKGSYLVATIHRREHTGDRATLERIFQVLSELGNATPLVLPLHPSTRNKLEEYDLTPYLTMHVVEPLGYLEFVSLMKNSKGVLTDSGGVQEELAHLGIPCITIRDNTERPVTISHGSNKLFPSSVISVDVLPEIQAHLDRDDFKRGGIPLWDKDVSTRILGAL